MSFGALSEEAKITLATGAELVGTGICSGEGGMLPEEQAAQRLATFFAESVELIQVMARLSGVTFAGFDPER